MRNQETNDKTENGHICKRHGLRLKRVEPETCFFTRERLVYYSPK